VILAFALLASQATTPGLTVWVWDVGGVLGRMPKIAEGQTPNAYYIAPTLDLNETIPSGYGEIKDTFVGRAFGELLVPETGTYNFRLTCDDGARLVLDGKTVLDTEWGESFIADGLVELAKGAHKIEVPFYENTGRFYLRLEWKKAGADDFIIVPSSALRTEAGQTFVTSPGDKRFFFETDPRKPGDGRPVAGVHPMFDLETFRPPTFTPAVGGMTFLKDGRLAVCTWDQVGAVYLLRKTGPGVEDYEVQLFATGLGEPLGILEYDGAIYVTQKQEVTKLVDTDGDGAADRYEAIAAGWPASHDYHEFSFNLVAKDGALFVTTSVPLRGGWTYYNPGTGSAYPVGGVQGTVLKIDPKTGEWSVYARGLRTPNGMGIGPNGDVFVCDNQGSWLPSSRLNFVREGGFYGHQETPNGTVASDPPVVWFPHGEIGNSPSEPVLVPSGPFAGQMFVGDVTYGGIQRVFIEKVAGVYQGAVFKMTQGIEAGVNRLAWGPDGALYVGGIGSNGNWNHQNHRYGLQRLVPNGKTAFEMLKVEARPGGFYVTFTQPFDPSSVGEWEVTQYRYEPSEFYGGPKLGQQRLSAGKTVLSPDTRGVFLPVAGLKEGHVVHLRAVGLKSASGEDMWSTECWYTLNKIPK
jgi:hypothetical protein